MMGEPAPDHQVAEPFSPPRLAAYASGSLATGIFSAVPTVLLLYFCTQVLGIAPALAGAITVIPKVWGMFWDPFVGVWSDQSSSSSGRRKPFVAWGGALMCMSFVALFAFPYAVTGAPALWVGVLYFLLTTAYSLFSVPYVAFPAEATTDSLERNRLVTWRLMFGMLGVIVGSAGAPALIAMGGGGAASYAVMSPLIAGVCGLGVVLAYRAMPNTDGGPPVRKVVLNDLFAAVAAARAFRALLAAYVVLVAASGFLLAAAAYWVVFVLNRDESAAGQALAVSLLATIVAMPVWSWALARTGTRFVIGVAAVLYGVSAALLIMVEPGTFSGHGLGVFAAIGVAGAGLQVGPFKLAADLLHMQGRELGQRFEGLMTGLWVAGEKLGLAIGAGTLGLALSLIGFQSGSASQTQEVVHALRLLVGLGPLAFAVAGLGLLLALARRSSRPV